jgi:AraC-like DNA-binding protein
MHIVSRAAHVELLEEKGGYAFKLKIYEGARQVPRQRAEYVLANVVKQCRWISGRSIRPTAVHFVYPAPANREPYVNFFQCPLHFGASVYAVHFSRDDLTLPLPNFNPTLSEMHERFAMEHLNRLESGSISYRIRDLIVKQLPDGDPSRIDIAKALHVSERTLQRRLQDEGIAFSELVDNTRRELADEYLKQSKMTLSQIAYLLGFRTQSTFFRACKRWFGMPPSEYREQT